MLLIRYLLNFVERIYEYYTLNTDYIDWSVVFRKYPYIIIQFTYYERLKKNISASIENDNNFYPIFFV